MKRLLTIALIWLSLYACQQPGPTTNTYPVIPQPNSLVPKEGTFQLNNQVTISVAGCTDEVQAIAQGFSDRLRLTAGIEMDVTAEQGPADGCIRFVHTEGMEKEAYRLSVSPQGITVTATQPNGFYYGVQTLYQLLPPAVYGTQRAQSDADWCVPAVEIDDAPRLPYRGLMLDVCRHFSSLEYIYKYIDMLAMHKMNVFHWHLTDDQGWRIEIKKHPRLTEHASKRKQTMVGYYYENWPLVFDGKEHGGYYTQEDIRKVVDYAAARYITVIPEIEMPGHAVAALSAYPQLSCDPTRTYEVEGRWGIFKEVFCPREETFRFLEDVIDEVVELFPSPYIHIGGDECPKTAWEHCPHCQALIRQLGLRDDVTPNPVDGKRHTKEEKLQSYFVTRMEKYINAKGRRIIGWDEILEGGLAPNATVMSWRGTQGGINAARAGHDAIMTPNPFAYLDQYQEEPDAGNTTIGGYLTLKKTYSYNPVPDEADSLLHKHVIGLQGNMWNEYTQTDERRDYQTFPRAVALAETGWTLDRNKDWNSFCQRMVTDFERMEARGVKACRNFYDVNINTRRHGDTLMVELGTYYPGAEIRYTTDRTEPTAASTLYTGPFPLEGKLDLKAAAFLRGQMLGRVSKKHLFGNLLAGKPYTTVPATAGRDGDTFDANEVLGADTLTQGLTNGKRGDHFSYTAWCNFSMQKGPRQVVFTADMGRTQRVGRVVFNTLYNAAFRILPAGGAVVEVSDDGKNFRQVAAADFHFTYPADKRRKTYNSVLRFTPVDARYLRLTVKHGGMIRNGVDCRKDTPQDLIPANLYIDEVEAYAD